MNIIEAGGSVFADDVQEYHVKKGSDVIVISEFENLVNCSLGGTWGRPMSMLK